MYIYVSLKLDISSELVSLRCLLTKFVFVVVVVDSFGGLCQFDLLNLVLLPTLNKYFFTFARR